MWEEHVTTKGDKKVTLNGNYQDFFTNNDLGVLLGQVELGHKYTMLLTVSSTCNNAVEIGFAGQGGFLKVNVPGNVSNKVLKITGEWKVTPAIGNTALENRATCGTHSITIHKIQLFKGSATCDESASNKQTGNILILEYEI